MKKQFKWSAQKRNLKNLKKSALAELFEYSKINSYYLSQLNYFDGVHTPIVIDEEDYVHSGYEQVNHLEAAGIEEVNVIVIAGIENEVDAARLTDFSTFFDRKSYTDIAAAFEYLTKLLTDTKEGKQWANGIAGKHTRDKISKLMNVSTGTLGSIKALLGKAPELLKACDKGDVNFTDACKGKNKKNPKTPNEGLTIVPSEVEIRPLASIIVKFADGESFDVTIDNKTAKVISSGVEYKSDLFQLPTEHQSGDVDHKYDFHLSNTEYLSITYTTINKAA